MAAPSAGGRARRPAWVEVDLSAVAANVAALCSLARPAALCAVVKADAYGHGSVPVASSALRAGATWLGVALAAEGAVLREAGIDAPILVLSEPSPEELDDVVERVLDATGRIDLVHANGSRDKPGSGADRHDNFATGQLEPDAILRMVKGAGDVPVICETPWPGIADDIAYLRANL
ncbi:MAG: alanine racemase [Actinobacteria bacterium]|nr:alanine racemase [Actinomycetota bacterium]